MRGDYTPQADIFDPDRFGHGVTIIGLGGAGSAIALALMKMGVRNITGYDGDFVEEHNAPAQLLYSQRHITEEGMPKAKAVEAYFADNPIDERQRFTGVPRFIEEDDLIKFDGVVISAVDSMKVRSRIWRLLHPHPEDAKSNPERYDQALQNELDVSLYIDCRMGARLAQIHAVIPENVKNVAAYESWFFSDEEANDNGYGERTFIGSPMVLAGMVADLLASHYRDEPVKSFIEFDLGNMSLTSA